MLLEGTSPVIPNNPPSVSPVQRHGMLSYPGLAFSARPMPALSPLAQIATSMPQPARSWRFMTGPAAQAVLDRGLAFGPVAQSQQIPRDPVEEAMMATQEAAADLAMAHALPVLPYDTPVVAGRFTTWWVTLLEPSDASVVLALAFVRDLREDITVPPRHFRLAVPAVMLGSLTVRPGSFLRNPGLRTEFVHLGQDVERGALREAFVAWEQAVLREHVAQSPMATGADVQRARL